MWLATTGLLRVTSALKIIFGLLSSILVVVNEGSASEIDKLSSTNWYAWRHNATRCIAGKNEDPWGKHSWLRSLFSILLSSFLLVLGGDGYLQKMLLLEMGWYLILLKYLYMHFCLLIDILITLWISWYINDLYDYRYLKLLLHEWNLILWCSPTPLTLISFLFLVYLFIFGLDKTCFWTVFIIANTRNPLAGPAARNHHKHSRYDTTYI